MVEVVPDVPVVMVDVEPDVPVVMVDVVIVLAEDVHVPRSVTRSDPNTSPTASGLEHDV